MNERIKQLKHQASLWCDMNIPDQFSEYGYGEAWEDKFAELIVLECAEVADNADATREKWEGIGKYVREHFGVE